jgi:ABC-type multidrug transport system fused ATPase/permease subunit
MITHKLTEAQLADKIMVIKDGKVINSGTHDELLTTCKLYQTLWNDYLSHSSDNLPPSPSNSIRP